VSTWSCVNVYACECGMGVYTYRYRYGHACIYTYEHLHFAHAYVYTYVVNLPCTNTSTYISFVRSHVSFSVSCDAHDAHKYFFYR